MEFLPNVTFIDIGAYTGDTLHAYVEAAQRGGGSIKRAHLFEPNPKMKIDTREFSFTVNVHRKAAWIDSKPRSLYLSRLYKMAGSTLLPEKTTGDLDLESPVAVECVDFPAWIARLEHHPLVIKVNAEGAEYALFDRLAELNLLQRFSVIYLSLHAHKIGMPPSVDEKLRGQLTEQGFEQIESETFMTEFFETYHR